MTLSMTQRPFVLEKVQGVVCACECALQTALQPDSHRPRPWNIVQRDLFLLSCHQWS
jgi:hypothetical protein